MNFKSSLFGYNKEDVMNYVTALNSELAELRAKYLKETGELKVRLNDLNEKSEMLETQVADQMKVISEYKQHEEAVTRLSESIGKLYLVAKANAASIMDAAKQNSEQSAALAENTIKLTENAHSELESIKDELASKVSLFTEEINSLGQRLESAKVKVSENINVANAKAEEYDNISQSVATAAEN